MSLTRRALDELYGRLFELPDEELNEYISTVDLTEMDTHLVMGILCVAGHRKGLKDWDAFLERVHARLTELAPDRVDRLMKGFM